MAISGETLTFYKTAAASFNSASTDSLGGYRSSDKVEEVESTCDTGGGTTTQFRDSTAIDDSPVSPDLNTPIVDAGAYNGAADLIHWYRFGFNLLSLGQDFATAGTPQDLPVNFGGPIPTLSEQNGQFDQHRKSLDLNSPNTDLNQAVGTNFGAGLSTWGIADTWTIGVHCRPTTVTGNATLFNLSINGTGNFDANGIWIQREGSGLRVRIADTAGILFKDYTFNSFFSTNAWVFVGVRWDGATLSIFKDTSSTPLTADTVTQDDSVTQTDTARAAIFGGFRTNFASPNEEWFGQIHSAFIWDTNLSDTAVAAVAGFGDGVGTTVDYTDKWLLWVSGSNAMEAKQVLLHDNTTGDMYFVEGFSNAVSSGDYYRVFGPSNLFDDVTPAESAAGVTDYRGIVFQNDAGEQLTDLRFYLTPLDDSGVVIELAVGDRSLGTDDFPPIAVDTDEPDTLTTGTPGFGTAAQTFRAPRSAADASETPYTSGGANFNLLNGLRVPIWIKRVVRAISRKKDAAWLLVAEAASGPTSGVGPWPSGIILVPSLNGFTPNFVTRFDRTPRTFGGAIIEAKLLDLSTGVPIPGIDVDFEITVGPGSLVGPVSQVETDEDGISTVVYVAPNDEAEAGSTVTIQGKFGGDA